MSQTFSMTGFSSATISIPLVKNASQSESSLQMTLTLKSLNSKFFEASCKMPYALSQLETDIIKILKKLLHRGNVYLTIHMNNSHGVSAQIEPAMNTIAGYMHAIGAIQKEYAIPGTVVISDIINLPHIFQTQDQQLDAFVVERIMHAIEQAAYALIQSRLNEGTALEQDIMQRVDTMQSLMNKLKPRAAEVMELKKQQFTAAVEKLMNTHQDNQLLELHKTASFNQLEKLDIHEEITRFNMHIANLITILRGSEIEKGKKLDFTLQELFREVNTIASKCSDGIISSLAIDIKVELEKAREQTQNIV